MKFHLELSANTWFIQSYSTGQITVARPVADPEQDASPLEQEIFQASIVVTPQTLLRDWPPQGFAELQAEHFALLLELESPPEVVLFGTGLRLRFPSPALTAALTARNIGVEVMDTGAACRTYNILMNEGRNVAAALFMIQP